MTEISQHIRSSNPNYTERNVIKKISRINNVCQINQSQFTQNSIEKNQLYSVKRDQLNNYGNKTYQKLSGGGFKKGYIIGDKVVMEFLDTTDPQEKEKSLNNYKKLAGKNFSNLNNVDYVTNQNMRLERYQHTYERILQTKQRALDAIQRVYHIRDMLKGYGEMRQNNIKYHNDIKPDNVAFKEDGTAILADYDLAGNPGEYPVLEKDYGLPRNDVQCIYEVATRDIKSKQYKLATQSSYNQKINYFEAQMKDVVKNGDKLIKTKQIVEKIAAQEQKEIEDYNKKVQQAEQSGDTQVIGITNVTQKDIKRIKDGVKQVQTKVILSQYRKEVKEHFKASAATTVLNTIGAVCKQYNKTGSSKNSIKVGTREMGKGLVGVGGKYVEKAFNEKKILGRKQNFTYRMGGVGKTGINAGVQVGKQVINYLVDGKKLNKKNLIDSGKKVATNSIEFGLNQVANHGVKKLAKATGIQLAETAANYSAKSVVSAVGKTTVINTAKEVTKQSSKAVFKSTLKSSLRSNALFAVGGFVVGTAVDCLARDQDFGTAVKNNAKQAVGSTVGSALGAAIGSVVPILGTTVGGVIGGVLGGWISSWF